MLRSAEGMSESRSSHLKISQTLFPQDLHDHESSRGEPERELALDTYTPTYACRI